MINRIDCKKVISLLSLYIDNKLDDENNFFVETHLLKCGECYKKYVEMKEIVKNLHFEYEKLMDEFNKIDNQNVYKEYDSFYGNISPYMDNELSYEDSLKFRKFLLSSKTARKELANAFNLRNSIKQSVSKLTDSINCNYSKRIIKKLKNENQDSFSLIYKRAMTLLIIIITALIVISYAGLNYINYAHAHKQPPMEEENISVDENDLVEFTFDENNEALLINK